ncbi:MAG: hypothetical protein WAN50_00060 [Minisyncoccia bacterium]
MQKLSDHGRRALALGAYLSARQAAKKPPLTEVERRYVLDAAEKENVLPEDVAAFAEKILMLAEKAA